MHLFTRNKISGRREEAAARLKQARLEKKLSLADAAKNLNINLRYLTAIEDGRPDKLPAGIYGKNYLREYVKWLGLDRQEIIALYDLNENNTANQSQSDLFAQKVPGVKYFLSLPKIITNAMVIILITICVTYLGYYLNKITAPPTLEITNPAGDVVIKENYIEIRGLTEPEAEVVINGELILTNQAGYFSKAMDLKNGLNVVTISAQKKYSRKNYLEKKILVAN